MATQSALVIRRDDAYERIAKAAQQLAKGTDVEQGSALDIRHRDPMVEQVLRVEHVADTLEALAKAGKAGSALQDEAAIEKAKQAADAPLTVETVEVLPVSKARAK